MRRFLGCFVSFVALVSASAVWAQALPTAEPAAVGLSPERLARIEQVFQQEIEQGNLPGAVILVARDGQLVYSAALGSQDQAAGTAMSEDSLFRIYSMTKPLVSVAAMILMEEGKLQLTDPVSKFLPEFAELQVSVVRTDPYGKVSYVTVPAERQMTVQDLLRHTAGLAYGEITQNAMVKEGYAAAGVYNPEGLAYDARHVSAEDEVAGLAEVPLIHQPGTVWEYSLASDVLGRVVEQAAGMRLGAFLEERLFGPLKMEDSGFSVPQNQMTRLAQPFETDPTTGKPGTLIDVGLEPANDSGGAGGVSTAGDYLRFTQMLLNGGELDGVRILSPTTVALMTADHLGERITPVVTPGELLLATPGYTFGLGFAVREEAGIAGVPGSQGEYMWAGYGGTYFWVDPQEKVTAVLMTQGPAMTRAYYRKLLKQLVYQAIVDSPAEMIAAE